MKGKPIYMLCLIGCSSIYTTSAQSNPSTVYRKRVSRASIPNIPISKPFEDTLLDTRISHDNLKSSTYFSAPSIKQISAQAINDLKPIDNRASLSELSDPLFKHQWHLHGRGSGMNVLDAWDMGYNGEGVIISVLDDGIEHKHSDLVGRYEPLASYDIIDRDNDPSPRYSDGHERSHGTRCAGSIVANADNEICGVGIAPKAKVGGIRLIDGDITDLDEAHALNHALNIVDIYTNSWGPVDDGVKVEGPGMKAQEALQTGVRDGRNGLGSIYLFASGNGQSVDDCNCDGYANSIYTLSIGAVDKDHNKPWYSESCTAIIAVAYSSGGNEDPGISTIDVDDSCTGEHSGTSAATPLAAGVIALVLQANPSLTWRDVQYLIVQTSSKVGANDPSWNRNGANHLVSSKFGFGLLNAADMVRIALKWESVGTMEIIDVIGGHGYREDVHPLQRNIQFIEGWPIPEEKKGNSIVQSVFVPNEQNGGRVDCVETVTVTVTITHENRGDLEVILRSPMGTSSNLLSHRKFDNSTEGFVGWKLSTLHHWGEDPKGQWELEVRDVSENSKVGTLIEWSIQCYGVRKIQDIQTRKNTFGPGVLHLGEADTKKRNMFVFLILVLIYAVLRCYIVAPHTTSI
eukprot:CFRG0424T1